MMLVREDRQCVAHQRHVVGRADAHHVHRAHVLLGVLCRLVAEAERRDARTLVRHLLRFVERAAETAEHAHAGRAGGISADRHPAGDALHRLHLAARRGELSVSLRQRFELAHLRLHRGRRRRDVRAQRSLVLRKVARLDTSLSESAAHLVDGGRLLLLLSAKPRGRLAGTRHVVDHLPSRRAERVQ
ncbi:hypothetical protein [Burkholderia ambifaria]|uniref:hypothetical protein n=1 Tax=Burkholderia ambifaria TaxID=152480 RepID=UPI001E52DEEF|nr:hypothetical protein [Burkholderia ambifaria]